MNQVGRNLPRLEAHAKVTGRAEYIHHFRLPGMLHGKIFRSTVAHGRIKRIDTSAAAAIPGVHQVVTIDDILKIIPNPYYGPAFHDQPILAIGNCLVLQRTSAPPPPRPTTGAARRLETVRRNLVLADA